MIAFYILLIPIALCCLAIIFMHAEVQELRRVVNNLMDAISEDYDEDEYDNP